MSNFTVAIPDDLLARAKIDAATHGTSVNALVRALLEGHLSRQDLSLPGNYEILVKVALGQISVASSIKQLHLDSEDDLFLLLSYCGLPRPRVSDQQEVQMQERLTTILSRVASRENS